MGENNAYCSYFPPFGGFCQEKLFKINQKWVKLTKDAAENMAVSAVSMADTSI
ncbi:MAG: hypothetical protein LBB89_06740 [Treponema sp.]|jgi:hypothetical protein|nr:hypothetical protein [Treponema sp.]